MGFRVYGRRVLRLSFQGCRVSGLRESIVSRVIVWLYKGPARVLEGLYASGQASTIAIRDSLSLAFA